jgi:flagellin
MNAMSNYQGNSGRLTNNLEKLSSGYRINSAADDAAGLAISEKMRSQIAGLEKAQDNANDGISLIQTAEGALTEVNSMLTRLKTLATQSANGTYEDGVDRANLQEETNALLEEIDRISQSTNFNGINLLDGNLGKTTTTETVQKANEQSQIVSMSGSNVDATKAKAGKSALDGVTGYQVAEKAYYTAQVGTVGKGLGVITSGATAAGLAGGVAIGINFTDKDGVDRTLTLTTGKAGTAKLEDLVKDLTGENQGSAVQFAYDSLNEDQKEALDALRETFNISGIKSDGTAPANAGEYANIKFETKVEGGSGKINLITSKLDGADSNGALTGVATQLKTGTAADMVVNEAEYKPAGYELNLAEGKGETSGTLAGIMEDGNTLTIGGTTYEFTTGATAKGTNADGVANTAVQIDATGSDLNEKMKNTVGNLIKALDSNGITAVDVSTYTDDVSSKIASDLKIRFTDDSQISELQSGADISSTSDNLAIVDQAATKQKTDLTIAAGTNNTDSTLTIRYSDAEGNIKSKELAYKATNADDTNAAAISTALSNDSELSALFDITNKDTDGTTNTEHLKIDSKMEGNVAGQFLGLELNTAGGGSVTGKSTVAEGLADGKTLTMKSDGKGGTENMKAGDTVTVNGKTFQFAKDLTTDTGENTAVLLGATGANSLENLSKAMDKAGIKNSFSKNADGIGKITLEDKDNIQMEEVTTTTGEGLVLQVGDTADDFQKVTVAVDDMSSKGLGLEGLDISTQEAAGKAIDTIQNAVNTVSTQRGKLGALQNRLEHTLNNLDATNQNITAAESQIRDVDMAKEMTQYSKNNILVQAAQSMLAQANSLPQGVLSLLQ